MPLLDFDFDFDFDWLRCCDRYITTAIKFIPLTRRGSRGGETGEFSPPPPLFLSPLLSFLFLIPQILIGSNTLLQKFTPHFKILDPRLLTADCFKYCTRTKMAALNFGGLQETHTQTVHVLGQKFTSE